MMTVIEQSVAACRTALEKRLEGVIKPTAEIRGYDQAMRSHTLMQIINELMPEWSRMLFRLQENERSFTITIVDSLQKEAEQKIEIQFCNAYQLPDKTWRELIRDCPAAAIEAVEGARQIGMSTEQIARRFGTTTEGIYAYLERYRDRDNDAMYKNSATRRHEWYLTSSLYKRRIWVQCILNDIKAYGMELNSTALSKLTNVPYATLLRIKQTSVEDCPATHDYGILIKYADCQLEVLKHFSETKDRYGKTAWKMNRDYGKVFELMKPSHIKPYDYNSTYRFNLWSAEALDEYRKHYEDIKSKILEDKAKAESAA